MPACDRRSTKFQSTARSTRCSKSEGAMRRLEELLPDLKYDICAMTGDYRGATFGPFDDALEGMKRLRFHLGKSVYGVLGNHDTIRMVPGLEDMGIRILLN